MATRKTPRPIKGFAASPSRRRVIQRAANDMERGREDSECRGEARTAQPDCPRPSKSRGSRR